MSLTQSHHFEELIKLTGVKVDFNSFKNEFRVAIPVTDSVEQVQRALAGKDANWTIVTLNDFRDVYSLLQDLLRKKVKDAKSQVAAQSAPEV